MSSVWVDCPKCDGQIEVQIEAEPGEPARFYPNDKAHPGSPPEVEIVDEVRRSGCECDLSDDWDLVHEENWELLIEHADEAMQAAEDEYYDRRLREEKIDRHDVGPNEWEGERT